MKLREQCDENLLFVDYQSLKKSVKKGSKIFIADGLLSLEVTEVNEDHVMTKVLNDASISSRKNCNLPGAIIDLPAVSEKDVKDLQFGVKNEVKYMHVFCRIRLTLVVSQRPRDDMT